MLGFVTTLRFDRAIDPQEEGNRLWTRREAVVLNWTKCPRRLVEVIENKELMSNAMLFFLPFHANDGGRADAS